jgi:hypothetical protein
MKAILYLSALLFTISVRAQSPVPPDSAKYHVGALTTVCGIVKGTHTTKSGMIFLNFGNPYPDQTFTAVIPDSVYKLSPFPVDSMKGKNVCVTGRMVDHQGKPEIKISSKGQLRIQ